MDDAKIKKAFNTWRITNPKHQNLSGHKLRESSFYAGFLTAERLSKIEVLEKLIKENDYCHNAHTVLVSMQDEINRLKAGQS
jgi:ATP sulfurylase